MDAVLRKAKELAEALASSQEYSGLEAARREIESHEAAKIMFEDFRKRQLELQELELAGEKVPEDKITSLQKSYEIMCFNPYIRDLFTAEMKFGALMIEVQRIIGEAVGLKLPGETGEKES